MPAIEPMNEKTTRIIAVQGILPDISIPSGAGPL